jgi:hypothetical protein
MRDDYNAIAKRRQAQHERSRVKLVLLAKEGETAPLCEFLPDAPFQMSPEDLSEHLKMVAWLIETKLTRGKRGKRKVRRTFAKRLAAYLLRIGKQAWCRKHGYSCFPKSELVKLADYESKRERDVLKKGDNPPLIKNMMDYAIKVVEHEFPNVRGKIDRDAVLAYAARPQRDVIACVREFLSEAPADARAEMVAIAER